MYLKDFRNKHAFSQYIEGTADLLSSAALTSGKLFLE